MIENFRRFQAGPDPFGRTWDVQFRWQQNGISIRHADTIDVKFHLSKDGVTEERVLALPHPDLLALCAEVHRPITDAFVLKLAALHVREMILTDKDLDKQLVTLTREDLDRHARTLEESETTVS
jgi:hypothetical protein